MERRWDRTGAKLQSIGSTLTKAITLPLVAVGGAAVKMSVDFDTAMTKIQTLASESASNMQGLRDAVLALAPTVGIGPKALAEGLLVIESTGFRGAEAIEILTLSAKASAIGLGDTKDIARALTAAITAYGVENLSAARAADILFATIDVGAVEASELAGELGRVVGVAANLGVSFEQVGAFIATYTRLGLSAAEATTGLSNVLNTILNPSKEARDALAGMGLSAQMLRDQVGKEGLQATLTTLTEKLKGNADATGAIFGSVRGLAAVLGVAGSQAQAYAANLDKIAKSTGILTERFAIWKETTAATWGQFTAGVQVATIAIGDRLAPAFQKMLIAAMPLLDAVIKLVTWFGSLPQPIQTSVLGVLALAAALGPVVFLTGTVLTTGSALIGVLKQIGAFAGISGAAGGLAAFGAGLAIVASGIAGLKLGTFVRELEVGKLSIGEWVEFLWAWKLGLAGISAENMKLAITSRRAGEDMAALKKSLGYTGSNTNDIDLPVMAKPGGGGGGSGGGGGLSDEIKQLAGTLGANAAKSIRDLAAAWNSLTPAQRANQEIIDNVVGAYAKLRGLVEPSQLPAGLELLRRKFDALSASNPLAKMTLTPGLQMQTGLLTGVGPLPHEMGLLIPQVKHLERISVEAFGNNIPESMALTNDWFKELRSSAQTTSQGIGGFFKDSFKDLFGGASSVKGGLKNIFGNVGKGLFQGIGNLLSGGISSLVGMAIGSLTKLVKGWFGVSEAVQACRAEQDKLVASFREMGATGTDFEVMASTVSDLFKDLGRDGESARLVLEGLMDTDHPERYAAAVRDVNAAMEEQKARWEGVQAAVGALNAFTAEGITSLGQYNIASQSAVAIFGAWVLKTGDVVGALAQLGPTLDALSLAQVGLGITGSAAVQQLLGLREVTLAQAPLMANIAQSTVLLQALGAAGLLTNESIIAFGQNAVNQFTLLKSATGNATTAMILMQPGLQTLWEHMEKFGGFADAATQALIDQAVTAGLVGPEMKSQQQQLLDVMKEIRDTLITISGIEIKDKTFKVTPDIGRIDIPDFPTRTQPQWSDDDVPQMASGGWVPPRPGGTLVNVGEGGEAELITPASRVGQAQQTAPIRITLVLPNNKVIGEASVDGILESPDALRKYRALVRQVG